MNVTKFNRCWEKYPWGLLGIKHGNYPAVFKFAINLTDEAALVYGVKPGTKVKALLKRYPNVKPKFHNDLRFYTAHVLIDDDVKRGVLCDKLGRRLRSRVVETGEVKLVAGEVLAQLGWSRRSGNSRDWKEMARAYVFNCSSQSSIKLNNWRSMEKDVLPTNPAFLDRFKVKGITLTPLKEAVVVTVMKKASASHQSLLLGKCRVDVNGELVANSLDLRDELERAQVSDKLYFNIDAGIIVIGVEEKEREVVRYNDRGHTLLFTTTESRFAEFDKPILTRENYTKSYDLNVIYPDGTVGWLRDLVPGWWCELADHGWVVDHCTHPKGYEYLVEKYGFYRCEATEYYLTGEWAEATA